MHGFDISAGLLLLAGGIWSGFRGLTREVISLLGLMAAFIFSAWGYPYVAGVLAAIISLVWLRHAIGASAIFIAIILSYLILAGLVGRMVKAVGLSPPDRVLGGLFGVIKIGVLIATGLLITTQFYPAMTARVTAGSTLAPYLFQTADFITTLLPRDFQIEFDRAYRRMGHALRTTLPTTQSHPKSNLPSAAAPQAPKPSPQAAPSGISTRDEHALRRLIRER